MLLAAPGTTAERLGEIGRRSRGFVYCVATYGVTGARESLDDTARGVVDALRPETDLPLLVGVGIGTPGARDGGLDVRRRGRGGQRPHGARRRRRPGWSDRPREGLPRRDPDLRHPLRRLGTYDQAERSRGLANRGWDVIVTLDPRETEKKGGFMEHRRWFKAFALVAVLSVVAAACASDSGDNTGNGGGVDCATVEFGCVEVGADEAINLGAEQVITGADSTLGQDQVNALELALDHLDGKFDQKDGTLLDHPVKLTTEDELCSAEGGQTAGTALAADASIVAVVGTSCSSAALGVSDKLLGDKGILFDLGIPTRARPSRTRRCTTRSTPAPPTTTASRARSSPSSRSARMWEPRRQPRSPTRVPTPRASWGPSRRTSKPAGAP